MMIVNDVLKTSTYKLFLRLKTVFGVFCVLVLLNVFVVPVFASTSASATASVSGDTVPDGSGMATLNNNNSRLVVASSTQVVTVIIDRTTTDPTISFNSLIANGSGAIPEITITAENAAGVVITIPASVITSADPTWNGVMAAPTITTVTLPETLGKTKTVSTAIEVGFADAKLSFNKAVRISFPNEAGKRVGYSRTGIVFTEITDTCGADNPVTGNALSDDGECKINVGNDLVVWTKHFTKFATYTQTSISIPFGGGGSINPPQNPSTSALEIQRTDANKDNRINFLDFNILMANWGAVGSNVADFNKDGIVDFFDFNLLMIYWTG